jgi:hypothetical protein
MHVQSKKTNLANHLGYILGLSGPNPLAVGENENEGAKKQASEKRSERSLVINIQMQ